jgi:MSHA biogenesis protein MshL
MLTGCGGGDMGKSLTALVACLMCFACAHVDVAKEPPKVTRSVEIPSPVLPQVEKEKKIEIEGPKELFSFSLRDAEVKDVLRGIAKQTNYNVVVEPDVKGVTTVDLKNVTLQKALDYILEPLQYTYKMEAGTIYVSKPKLETRVYPINYILLKKKGLSKMKGSSASGGTSTGTTAAQSDVSMDSDSDADFWKELDASIKALLSSEGKSTVSPVASMVTVNDYQGRHRNVEGFLSALSGAVHRQVLIEAKIIEVTLNNTSQQGINWQFIQGRIGEFMVNAQQALTLPQTAIAPFFRLNFGGRHLNIENTFIDLLETQGKVTIVSNPRVNALNNQRSLIKVATEDVIFISSTQPQVGALTPIYTTIPQNITVGLLLDVVAQFGETGDIVLNIHPILTERTGVERTDQVTGNKYPVLTVREVDTMARVKDGETVVIGGLIKERRRDEVRGVTGAMSVPLLGNLFKSKGGEVEKTELVILLTTRIVYGRDAI